MPSTRITIIRRTVSNNEGSAASGVKDLLHRPRTVSSTNLSPTAKLLVETVNCIRSDNSSVTRTFLLSGPPGVGKTFSVRMAFETSDAQGPTKLVSLQGSELLSSSSHPSEAIRSLRRCFQKTAQFCQGDNHVGMVFIDECEALLSSQAVAATLAGLLDCITGSTADQGWKKLIVVAATNRIDSVPSWLRRPGRLDREIAMGPPNATERKEIIRALLKQSTFPSSDNDDFGKVAEACVGYVPADLAALVRQAALLAFREGKDYVTAELLRNAMADVGASVSPRTRGRRKCTFCFLTAFLFATEYRLFGMLPFAHHRKLLGMISRAMREGPRYAPFFCSTQVVYGDNTHSRYLIPR